MNEHIKLFETHSDYEEYINSQDKILPNVSFCKDLEEVHYNEKPHDYSQDYLTFVAKESGIFAFLPNNSNVISYSTDNGETWTKGDSSTELIIEVNNDDKVLWKGTMTPTEYRAIGKFGSTANFDVQGNIMSLLYGDNFNGQTDLTGKNRVFRQLFQNTKVINAENLSLPATTLVDYCYDSMFAYCTSLTTTPKLLATTMATACYAYMFIGCTSLVSVPVRLPATTLESSCYLNMFQGCTSLTTAPELPATTLASQCYQGMFVRCTSLTTAPELPATTLVSNCYRFIFQNCTNLNYIKAMFTTTPSDDYTMLWVDGVAATGTFVKNMSATWNVTGANGIPTGWTVELDLFGGDDNGEIDAQ